MTLIWDMYPTSLHVVARPVCLSLNAFYLFENKVSK